MDLQSRKDLPIEENTDDFRKCFVGCRVNPIGVSIDYAIHPKDLMRMTLVFTRESNGNRSPSSEDSQSMLIWNVQNSDE